jgi:hypothetical protein
MSTLLVTPALEEMTQLIRYQMEEAEKPEDGWWDIWCQDCDAHDVSDGRESLEHFAEKSWLFGWIVNDLKRGKALCFACSNKTPEVTWASQYEDERGLLG